MSSRPPQPLQPGSAVPTTHGDQNTQNFGFAPHTRSHGHFGDPLTTGSATDSVHEFRLRNTRSAMLNSDLPPSNFRSKPYDSSTTSSIHSLGAISSSPETCTKSFILSPPTVKLPSGDSTPQRVDSGFHDEFDSHPASPASGNSLRIQTDLYSAFAPRVDGNNGASTSQQSSDKQKPNALSLSRKSSAPSLRPVSRTPSFKTAALAAAHGFGSANSSRVPSPVITAMGDVTPLPSPLLSGDSPGPWKRLHGRPPSREISQPHPTKMAESVLVTSNGEWVATALANQSKRKAYSGASNASGEESSSSSEKDNANKTKIHTRNRSISEYHPDHINIPKRMLTVSGPHAHKPDNAPMRREPHLSEVRGLTPIEKPPSPPPSESSVTATEASGTAAKELPQYEYFDARGRRDGKLRRWRAVKTLGQGTFSRVVLATSHLTASEEEVESESNADTGVLTPEPPASLERKSLVAVKICEHGPKGGASEDRVEMSLKRELEIMQSIHHPSLVDLKAFSIEPTRAILVLSYCPGGDLFDVATKHRELLVPSLLRRIFSELVGAIRYLHERHIVHRDIKLENVLVNLTPQELSDSSIDWQTYPYSVTTLTDLGLSRRVADDEKLTTRCGSEDYAAPEVIMGLQYDGRTTDAWSLGVLLYALLESRLPFDPPPGMSDALRMRSRTSHRIARAEWQWVKYAGDDGDHEGDVKKFEEAGMLGAMEVTEGLLQRSRSRWSLEKVAEKEWVSGGIAVEGGMRFREEKEGEIV
ncbi:Serine/threonine-protein kinase PRR1 [Cytospora mali]|uniref:Serine/threonine-protein kinase PRR1 n=1 Tax=Cytospora mali TaxID=578113 RepID=A0A194VAL8_CYTMA|nr:Serine/threonine-protein kinase PRR1 [Valsa mali var. pyri (nom. inval.)]